MHRFRRARASPKSNLAAPATDPALGKLLNAFGGLAAAWYIEKRCDHLGKDLKAEFERNVAQTNIGLSRKVDVKFLVTIQQSGQKVAETKTCETKRESSSSAPSP